jgi:long-chain fatty acid transport protein
MRKYSFFIITILLLIGLNAQVFATNGTQIGAVGARALGMGGMFRGLSNDWSAVYFNPAGLTQLESKWTFGGSFAYIMPRGSHTPYAYPAQYLPFSGYATTQVDAEKRNFPVPALGIFFKPSDAFVVGLGVYAPNGLGAEFDLMSIPTSYGNPTGFASEAEHFSDHMVINVQPTFALKISDFLSVGLGLSYMWGMMDLNMGMLAFNPVIEEIMPGVSRWAGLQLIAGGLGLALPDLTADQYRLATELIATSDGSAFGANLGVMLTLSEQFQVGLNMRYSTDLKLKGKITQTYIMHGDQAKLGVLAQIPDINFADASDPTGAANKQATLGLFSGQNINQLDDVDMEAELPLPMEIGGGIAFRPSPKFTITADAKWTQWSKWDEVLVMPTGEDDLPLTLHWQNTIELGAGLEVMAFEKNGSQGFFRAGFYTVDSPVPDETLNPTLLDPERRYGVTGGFGINFGNFSLDAAVEYVMFGDKDLTDYVFDAMGVQENYAGLYSFNALILYIGTNINLN